MNEEFNVEELDLLCFNHLGDIVENFSNGEYAYHNYKEKSSFKEKRKKKQKVKKRIYFGIVAAYAYTFQ